MVTVYSLPSCPQCDTSKSYLKRNGIEFQEVDLSQDEDAMTYVQSLGYTAAPVIVTEKGHWSGFRFDLLKSLK
jgi:glutaredoxin-like protein NrdH